VEVKPKQSAEDRTVVRATLHRNPCEDTICEGAAPLVRDIAEEFIMVTTKSTPNAKVPKDLPAKKPVKGGYVIDWRTGAGDRIATEYSRIYSPER
jgi:hypothetical protein